MAGLAAVAGLAKNTRLREAIYRHRIWSADGLSERLFGLLFSGLVYPQIWEDPEVDMEAMALGRGPPPGDDRFRRLQRARPIWPPVRRASTRST